jgi:moderate conductance mechanosensitive channel
MPATPVLAILGQVSDARMDRVCGSEDALNPICAAVLRATNNRVIASFAGNAIPALLKILLILVIAFFIHRLLKRGIKRFTRGLATQTVQRFGKISSKVPLADTRPLDLSRASMRTETMGAVLNSIATFVVWAIAFLMILGALGIQLAPLLAGAGIAGVALGFGAQNLVQDFLGGLFIILEDQYGIGDIVDLRDSMGSPGAGGTVEAISLRTTRIRDVEGVVWHVPNGEIRASGNKSQQWARSLIDVGVAYDTNVEHAIAVIKTAADSVWQDPEWDTFVIEEPEVWGLERFDADSLAIRLVVKVQPAMQWKVNRQLRQRIKAAFDEAGIEIPFPQRTIWLRTDADGAAPKDAAAPWLPSQGS